MRLGKAFFSRDVLVVAPELIGSILVRKYDDTTESRHVITDIEIYRGMEDLACHASKGKTPRNSVMFEEGGLVYVYFIYGMHWLLNIVTGTRDDPQAILIRGLHDCSGPARLTKRLAINGEFYAEDLSTSSRLWLERGSQVAYEVGPRIGIDYAGEYWKSVPWRYFVGSASPFTLPKKNS